MLVEKKRFELPAFTFELNGQTLPVAIGYETYGHLNPARDNAILLCHYFTGTGHAAGKYAESDPAPGWWDSLIGPGKPIDTGRWFVICSDTIGNINAHNPAVITTGPATIDAKTGKPYAMRFPLYTLRDMIEVQRALLDSLKIEKLAAVVGPSMGGLQAFMWARHHPQRVGKVVACGAVPFMRPANCMVPNQLGIDAIRLDPAWKGGEYARDEAPNQGLLLAFRILLTATRTDDWCERNFGRRPADPTGERIPLPEKSWAGRYLVDTEIEKTVVERMRFFDANSYMYIAKANMLFDLRVGGESLEAALGQINSPTLMIIDESDLMFTVEQAGIARPRLPKGEVFTYNSRNGHLSVLFDTGLFGERLGQFLA